MNSLEWYNAHEAAAFLKVNVATLRRWRAQGLIATSRLGNNTIRISGAELERFLRDHMVEAPLTTLPSVAE